MSVTLLMFDTHYAMLDAKPKMYEKRLPVQFRKRNVLIAIFSYFFYITRKLIYLLHRQTQKKYE